MRRLVVIATGDRHAKPHQWFDVVRFRFREIREARGVRVVLLHGDCEGIDRIADECGRLLAWEVIPMPAPWDECGKQGNRNAAGPLRNRAMLTVLEQLVFTGYEPLVLAFHDSLSTSRGTRDMVNIACKAGIPVDIIRSDRNER